MVACALPQEGRALLHHQRQGASGDPRGEEDGRGGGGDEREARGPVRVREALRELQGFLQRQRGAPPPLGWRYYGYEEPAQDGEDPEGEGRRGGQEDGHDGVIAPTPSYVFSEYQMDDLRG